MEINSNGEKTAKPVFNHHKISRLPFGPTHPHLHHTNLLPLHDLSCQDLQPDKQCICLPSARIAIS